MAIARLAAAAVLAGSVALAAGCGGGGGGVTATGGGGSGGGGPTNPSPQPPDNPPPPPPPDNPSPPSPPDPDPPPDLQALAASYEAHSDYQAAWGLAQINAATAYARIAGRDGPGTAPGAGRVAVIDNGIDADHWEFDGLATSETCHPSLGCGDRSHGTPVASVIAARRDNTLIFDPPEAARYNFHGVAWGIDRLDMLSIPFSSRSGNYMGIAPEAVDNGVHGLAGYFSALQQPADFVNMSFGTSGLVENYDRSTFEELYAPAIQTLAQTDKATGKTILVMAAGNAHGVSCASPEPNCVGGRIDATSPGIYAGLPVFEQSLQSHMVAVAATDRNGGIASFSNRCGVAAKWCIAAPGDWMRLASYNYNEGPPPKEQRGYDPTRGTSFAAPFVTGGLAVLKHWFQSQLANEALLERLLPHRAGDARPRACRRRMPRISRHRPRSEQLRAVLRAGPRPDGPGRGDRPRSASPPSRSAAGWRRAACRRRRAGWSPGARSAMRSAAAWRGGGSRCSICWARPSGSTPQASPGGRPRPARRSAALAPLRQPGGGRAGGGRAGRAAAVPYGRAAGRAPAPRLPPGLGRGAVRGGGAVGVRLHRPPARARRGRSGRMRSASPSPGGRWAGRWAWARAGWRRRKHSSAAARRARSAASPPASISSAPRRASRPAAGVSTWRPNWGAPCRRRKAGCCWRTAAATLSAPPFRWRPRAPLGRGTLRLSLEQPLRVEGGHLDLSLPVGRTPEGGGAA